jgi:excisionase family DNA binding protein
MTRLAPHYAPTAFDREGAAHYLSVSVRVLEELQRQGHIIPKQLGTRRLFLRRDLEEFAERLPDWERKTTTT